MLQTLFEDTIKDTMAKHQDSPGLWFDTRSLLEDLSHSVIEKATVKHFQDGLVGMKFDEWQRNIFWSMTAVFGGAYQCAIRELRFMLEDATQSVYTDQTMRDVEIEAKIRSLQMIEDARMRGEKIIKKCDIHPNVKTGLKDLYMELSGYVHPSEYVTRESLTGMKFTYFYNEREFKECVEIHRSSYDGLIALLLSFFGADVTIHFLETASTNDRGSTVQEVLENLGFNLALTLSNS